MDRDGVAQAGPPTLSLDCLESMRYSHPSLLCVPFSYTPEFQRHVPGPRLLVSAI